ncbi:hypothetical protein [Stenotrophomonas sp. S39]|uniref:hypothetical protein n=1 Tax=Stenotrophomonas sp. S39 TaxID=2767451 RepID=UPI00190BF389|nr:hypothetical protein [Stenotrophomonas sp. S39]MBK0052744.1 hypothetical protein [Stenotrophomonas sp. S39]
MKDDSLLVACQWLLVLQVAIPWAHALARIVPLNLLLADSEGGKAWKDGADLS